MLARGTEAIGLVPAFVFDVPLDLVIPPALARVILPFARGPLGGLATQRTFFLGNVAGEEGRVGLLPGHALADVAAFIHARACAKAAELGAPMRVWKDFTDEDRGCLDDLCAGGRVFRIPSYPGTAMPLARGGYAAYQAGLNARARRKIGVKLRRGEAYLPLRSEILVAPGEAVVGEMFALFERTAARATTRFERLTQDFFRTIACSPEASFVALRDAGGRLRAFMLLLDLGSRVVNQFVGLDYDAGPEAHLHFRLFVAAYDHASRGRATHLCSGQTGYRLKLDLGHRLVPLWNYCEHANALVNRLFRAVGATIRWETLDPQLAEHLRARPESSTAGA